MFVGSVKMVRFRVALCFFWLNFFLTEVHPFEYREDRLWPTVMVSVLVRNKAHTLPYFLSHLYDLDYPKERIVLWISSDKNIDNSIDIMNVWLQKYKHHYHSVYLNFNATDDVDVYKGANDWTESRFHHIIFLREKALNKARSLLVDYLFMLDADVFLTNPNTLQNLIVKELKLVAPMLRTDGLYSNFWCGMTDNYYYKRTDDYTDILYNRNDGCFPVPMIHSAILMDFRTISSQKLTYDPSNLSKYRVPLDDIIAFAVSANKSGIPLHVCNDNNYGYITIPLDANDTLENDHAQLINLKVESSYDEYQIKFDPIFDNFIKSIPMNKIVFDEIYMINLKRRTNRRKIMEKSLKELSLDVNWIDAVDGKQLNNTELGKWGIEFLPGYLDPYLKRPMTMGEIGCFLSHYKIWEDIVKNGHQRVIVLEDDVHFQPYFSKKLNNIMNQIEEYKISWDLIYLGRKKMSKNDEEYITPSLVLAEYSYWTLGYIISNEGAKKLLHSKPLSKLLPVDEYLPIMFDKHPESSWSTHFYLRNLIALSVDPLLVHPTHYTGEEGYISDTEDSLKINDAISNMKKFKEDL